MSDHIRILITDSQNTGRIDKVISKEDISLTRSRVQNLISAGSVTVNNVPIQDKNYRVNVNDLIDIFIYEAKELENQPENIPLNVVYEDDDLLVVNKPKGMVVHPAAGNYTGTLVNALLYHCKGSLSGVNGVIRPGIVHRIDKDTSGLLIVAKNDFSHLKLAQQIKEHTFSRRYEAVVYGKLKNLKGRIEAPIGRHKIDRKKMAVTLRNSRNAVTNYEVIKEYKSFTHVRLKLETGRTHQIRVHMAYIGHPLAGDKVYGPKKCIEKLNGQCLHAKTIGFVHPRTNEYLEFTSELPEYFTSFLKSLDEI